MAMASITSVFTLISFGLDFRESFTKIETPSAFYFVYVLQYACTPESFILCTVSLVNQVSCSNMISNLLEPVRNLRVLKAHVVSQLGLVYLIALLSSLWDHDTIHLLFQNSHIDHQMDQDIRDSR